MKHLTDTKATDTKGTDTKGANSGKVSPGSFIASALYSHGITHEYSKQCLEETAQHLQNPGLEDQELNDLTHYPFVTIDNEDSRDLDQALYIEREGEGYRVMYALADASYYIQPGSALFNEALQRGTTFYTPVLAVPMLPTALSTGLISLNPDVCRRALVFDMRLDNSATVCSCQILRAKILSHAKLSYGGVQQWLDSKAKESQPYHPALTLLKEVGIKLIAAGVKRGVVGFNRTEAQIKVSGSPARFVATRRKRHDTERYNEQISLLCNMQGAELLLGLSGVSDVLQAVFRVHEAPLKKSLNALKATLNELANSCENPELWQWHEGETLAQYVEKLPEDPIYARRVRAIERQIMQAQRGSTFTPEPGEHHALKACSYARFSSPMREIVGIFTHKELLEALSGKQYDNDADNTLREQVITAANVARQTQRKLDKDVEFAALHNCFMHHEEHSDAPWHEGTIMGMRTDKIYISLDAMALDVKVYQDDLNALFDTSYTLSNTIAVASDTQAPSWQLGQGVTLRLQRFDAARQRFVFDMKAHDDAA